MKLKYNEFIQIINKKKFINYYKFNNIHITANYYNTSENVISKYCKEIGYRKDKFQEAIDKISKEELYQYYIIEDHEWKETANHFGISTWNLDKLNNYYKIRKDKSKVYKKALSRKWEEAGSKEDYYKYILNKAEQTHLEKYGSLDAYNKIRSQKYS